MRILGAVAIVCALFSTARADQQEADRLFAEGRELLTTKNDPKGACEKFEQAIKLDPVATGTMLNLGLCYEKQGKYATSLRWFRRAQATSSEANSEALRAYKTAAEEHTAQISGKVSIVRLEVNGPPDTVVRIDGQKIEVADYGRVEVDSGEHEIVGTANGMKPSSKKFSINEAETKDLSIAVTQPATILVDRGKGRRRLAIVVGSVGVASLGACLGFNFYWQARQKDTALTDAEFEDYKRYMRVYGTSMFVVGTALVAGAAVMYLTAPGVEEVVAGRRGASVVPVVGGDQVGFAVTGRF